MQRPCFADAASVFIAGTCLDVPRRDQLLLEHRAAQVVCHERRQAVAHDDDVVACCCQAAQRDFGAVGAPAVVGDADPVD